MFKPDFHLVILLILSSYMATVQAQAQKTVVPDINAEGKRGDFARTMHARSSLRFLRADGNHDYRISSEEASKHLIYIDKRFSRYDKNSDSSLNWQEFLGHNVWPAPVHENAVLKQ